MRITNTPNILFIVIDALRAKNLGCYGDSKPISPNIDNLAREGILFENAFSCSNVTDASLTTIFSGMYPMSHGILGHGGRWRGKKAGEAETRKLDQFDIHLLPEMLKAKGHVTLGVDWLGRWHTRGYNYYSKMLHEANPISFPVRKVDACLNSVSRRYGYLQKTTSIDDAKLVTAHAIHLIEKLCRRSFFLFVHYWDTHSLYAAPTSFYEKIDSNGIRSRILALLDRIRTIMPSTRYTTYKLGHREYTMRYLVSIAYVDYQVGILIDALKNHGILDKTLIILTSDHGESLTEHGIYFDHHGLYDVSIHVPLIFRYPSFGKKERVEGFVQHFDLVPTVLALLGIEEREFDGKSLLPLIYGETDCLHSAVYAEEALYERKRAIRTIEYKYIQALSEKGAICSRCRRIHGGVEELYDIKKDPEETQNIVEEKTSIAGELERRLYEWINHLS